MNFPPHFLNFFFFWRGRGLAGGGPRWPQQSPADVEPPYPQWGSHVISEKSTRVGPQLGLRRTESRHVATPSYWEQPSKGRTRSLHGNLLYSSSMKCEQTAGWNLQFSPFLPLVRVLVYTCVGLQTPVCSKATAQSTRRGFNFQIRLSCLLHWNFLRIWS